ncbi:hypothetical protein SteCoe_10408 [Stentor coeruleus]|uniref:Uncharacterized protein n=1 Tax=Stentor coeruleus TaxID=5963 RepID=A0A1R2CFX2_9CILI|nr:hypothetical protein SteCoe_10408 [Stentor coeruleus]
MNDSKYDDKRKISSQSYTKFKRSCYIFIYRFIELGFAGPTRNIKVDILRVLIFITLSMIRYLSLLSSKDKSLIEIFSLLARDDWLIVKGGYGIYYYFATIGIIDIVVLSIIYHVYLIAINREYNQKVFLYSLVFPLKALKRILGFPFLYILSSSWGLNIDHTCGYENPVKDFQNTLQIFSIVHTFILIVLIISQEYFIYDHNFITNNFQSKPNGQYNAISTSIEIFVIMLKVFTNVKFDRMYNFVYTISFAFILYFDYLYLPYYNNFCVYFDVIKYSFLVLAGFLKIIESELDLNFLIEIGLVVIYPGLLILILSMFKSRIEFFSEVELLDLKKFYEIEIYQRMNFQHYCIYKTKDPVRAAKIKKNIEIAFKVWKKRFRNKFLISAYETLYCFMIMKEDTLAKLKLYKLNFFKGIEPELLTIKYTERFLKDKNKTDFELFYEYLTIKKSLLEQDKHVLKLLLKYITSDPSHSEKESIGVSLYESIKSLNESFKSTIKIHSENAELLNLYGKFLCHILNKHSQGLALIQKSASITSNELQNLIYGDLNIFSNKIGHIIINTKPLGEIIKINKVAAEILESSICMVEKSNITMYLPTPFNDIKYIKKILRDFINGCEKGSINAPKNVFIITTKGFIKEITLKLDSIIFNNEFYFIAAIAPVHHAREYALFDSNNIITNNSELFGQFFNQSTKNLQCMPLSSIISQIFYSKNEKIQYFFHISKETYCKNLPTTENSPMLSTSENRQVTSTESYCDDKKLFFETEDYVTRGKIFIQLRKHKLIDITYNILFVTSSAVEKENWIKEGIEITDFHQSLNNFKQSLGLSSGLGLRSIIKKENSSLFSRQVKISEKVEVIEIYDTDFSTGPLKPKEYKDIPNQNKATSMTIMKSTKENIVQSVYSSFANASNNKNTHAFQVVITRKIKKTINVIKNGIYFVIGIFCMIAIGLILYNYFMTEKYQGKLTIIEVANSEFLISQIGLSVRNAQMNMNGIWNDEDINKFVNEMNDYIEMLDRNYTELLKITKNIDEDIKEHYESIKFKVFMKLQNKIIESDMLLHEYLGEYISQASIFTSTFSPSNAYFLIRNGLNELPIAFKSTIDFLLSSSSSTLNKIFTIEIYILISYVGFALITFCVFILPSLFILESTVKKVWKHYNELETEKINEMRESYIKYLLKFHDCTYKQQELTSENPIKAYCRKKTFIILSIFISTLIFFGIYFIAYYYLIYDGLDSLMVYDSKVWGKAMSEMSKVNEVFFWTREIQFGNESIYNIIPDKQSFVIDLKAQIAIKDLDELNRYFLQEIKGYDISPLDIYLVKSTSASGQNECGFSSESLNEGLPKLNNLYRAINRYIEDAKYLANIKDQEYIDSMKIQKDEILMLIDCFANRLDTLVNSSLYNKTHSIILLTLAYMIIITFVTVFVFRKLMNRIEYRIICVLKLNQKIIQK